MIKCAKCGDNNYEVVEKIVWKASVDKNYGFLDCYKNIGNVIESIICKNCGAEYGEHNFKEINFD